MRLDVVIPVEVTRGLNDREHYLAKARRVKAERAATSKALMRDIDYDDTYDVLAIVSAYGARVTLLRPYARTPLDSDNLSGAFKSVRDEVAAFLGVDDKSSRLYFRYVQCKAQRVGTTVLSIAPTAIDGGVHFDMSNTKKMKTRAVHDMHVRCRIEIVPVADVDPMQLAVRVLREAGTAMLVDDDDRCRADKTRMNDAIKQADTLANFNPLEMYV